MPAYLTDVVVLRVERLAERRQQLRPAVEAALRGHRRDEDADRRPDQRRRVADARQTFLLDEVGDERRELLKVAADVVLQYEAAQRARRLICVDASLV